MLLALLSAAHGAESDTGIATPPPTDPASSAPMREFTDAHGRLCRVYARQVVIEGVTQTAYETVCRDADGRWVLTR